MFRFFESVLTSITGEPIVDWVLVYDRLANRKKDLAPLQSQKLIELHSQARQYSYNISVSKDHYEVIHGVVTACRVVGHWKGKRIIAFSLQNFKKQVCIFIETEKDGRDYIALLHSLRTETPVYVMQFLEEHPTGFSMVEKVRQERTSQKGIIDLTKETVGNTRETYLAEM
jgi:hypothetical protein